MMAHMTPTTISMAISPMPDPTQSSPNTNPERAFSWHSGDSVS